MKTVLPGFWYLDNFNLKKRFCDKKHEILTTKIYNFKNNKRILKEVEKSYKIILTELSENFNRIHKLNWRASSWEIIIGPWLIKYLAVIYNRVLLAKENYKQKKKFYYTNPSNNNHLNTYDINDFISKVINNKWNEEIFKRLEKYFYYKKNKILFKENIIIKFKSNKKNRKSLFKNLINFIFKVYNFLFTRKSNFIFSRAYFGKKSIFIRLLLKLKEFPIIYSLDDDKINLKFDKNLRNKLSFKKSSRLSDNISRSLIKECLPRIYLEGFNIIKEKIKKSNLPKNKKIIFTSNLRNDSIFKFWLAYQKQIGAKIILAQHGGGYNMFIFHEATSYELKVCDKYLTWGWHNENDKKSIPFSILNHNIKPIYLNETKNKKGFSIVMNNFDQYVYANDPRTTLNLIESDKNFNYKELNSLIIFLNGLNRNLKKEITIRPHPSKLRKHTLEKFEIDFKNKFKFDRNFKMSGERFIENFKVNIFTQLQSTTTIFSLAKNFPTIIICPHDLKYFNLKTKKIISLLKKANIFHSSPKKAYKFLNKIYKNPNKWWKQKKTQEARVKFCNMHGKCSDKDTMIKLTQILLEQKNKELN